VSELAQAAYAAEKPTDARSGVRDAQFPAFVRAFDSKRYLRALRLRGFSWLARSDAQFPPLLAAIHDPPAGLFLRGTSKGELLALPSVAVVGARACSPYGAQVARMLGRELARARFVVVSGLARGIDGEAHRGALEANGVTIAVLGCGIDRDYPAAHAELAKQIARNGLVIAEYAPGVEPAPWRFPARNRIIAGLCPVTIVVEARERSGALITADFALEEGREVFACPGEITSALSAGTNELLRLGATPLTRPEDVLEQFGLDKGTATVVDVGEDAAAVLGRLDAAMTADELVRASELDAARTAVALSELELAGLVVNADGVYRRTQT
jgi:DNA processing protein